MNTNENIKEISKIVETQSKILNELIKLSSEQLKKIELLTNSNEGVLRPLDDTYERENASNLIKSINQRYLQSKHTEYDISKCNYIMYFDEYSKEKLIYKVIEDGNNNYQLFNPILNCAEYSCYDTVDELIRDYKSESDLIVFKSGSYTNMIPDRADSYLIYIDNQEEKDIKEVVLFEDDNTLSLIDDKGNALAEGESYEDLIFKAMFNYKLVVPIHEYYDTSFI